MTEEVTEKFETMEEIKATLESQIGALKGFVAHLLCLSTMDVAFIKGDTNFGSVAKELQEVIREQTRSVMKGQSPDAIAAAMRVQEQLLDTVMVQMKKETRLLIMAANNMRVPE